jgi:hypothetical protein
LSFLPAYSLSTPYLLPGYSIGKVWILRAHTEYPYLR